MLFFQDYKIVLNYPVDVHISPSSMFHPILTTSWNASLQFTLYFHTCWPETPEGVLKRGGRLSSLSGYLDIYRAGCVPIPE